MAKNTKARRGKNTGRAIAGKRKRRHISRRVAAHMPGVLQSHPDDVWTAVRLEREFDRYNDLYFSGRLRKVYIRVSRRMKRIMGRYATQFGDMPAEIAIAHWHVEEYPWAEVMVTLLHEMVHLWQDQIGAGIDHGELFKWKARRLGISDRAVEIVDL